MLDKKINEIVDKKININILSTNVWEKVFKIDENAFTKIVLC